jgi:GntR family transcriptional regulator, transcriptional repressor for pyruvate dehydrogenase complex
MVTDYETLIEPLKSKRTFEEVSDRLKELIFSGTLKPGQQLPSEHALAQLFQVGRQSVREAMRVLELSGFIVVRPGVKGGATIESTMLSRLSGIFLEIFKFDRISPEDCVAARKAIEASVLDFVFKNADSEDIQALRNNVMAARRKVHANKSAYEENLDFHRLLAKASKNYTFTIVMESILTVFSDFRSRHQSVSLKQSKTIVGLHESIVDALVANQQVKASELLKEDLAAAEKIMLPDKRPAFERAGLSKKNAPESRATVRRSRIGKEELKRNRG